jgi:hypothetical protein
VLGKVDIFETCQGERSYNMGRWDLLSWVPCLATKGVGVLVTGGGCSCYKGWDALR